MAYWGVWRAKNTAMAVAVLCGCVFQLGTRVYMIILEAFLVLLNPISSHKIPARWKILTTRDCISGPETGQRTPFHQES